MTVQSIDVAVKGLRENHKRQARISVLLVALPILLMALFAFAFGSGPILSRREPPTRSRRSLTTTPA